MERIGAKTTNTFIAAIYSTLWVFGLVAFLLIPINPNTDWPIALALMYNIIVSLVHFGFISIGSTLVPGYVYYAVHPKFLFIATDGIMFFALVGVIASYSISPNSSTIPLVGTWITLVALAIQLWKLYRLVKGGEKLLP